MGVTGGKSSEVGCGLLCTENILKGPTKRVSLPGLQQGKEATFYISQYRCCVSSDRRNYQGIYFLYQCGVSAPLPRACTFSSPSAHMT